MGVREAVAAAERLRDARAGEAEAARSERRPIRELDSGGLWARAAARTAFLERARGLERELSAELSLLGEARGPVLPALLAEIRSLAAGLRVLDGVNRRLASEALRFVRGHLGALRPAPTGYDRRGVRAGPEALGATVSRRV